MLRSRLMYLLEMFESGRLTEAEQIELDHWFDEVSEQQTSTEGSLPTKKIYALSEEVWKEVQTRIAKPAIKPDKPGVRNFLQWAAAVIFLLGIGSIILFINKETGRVKVTSQSSQRYNSILNNTDTTQTFRLNDCSVINLAAGSQISYSSAFGSTSRSIELEGMAYFSVEKGQPLPFVVNTGSISTTALGTSFTIDTRQTGTTLIKLHTGRVRIDFNNTDKPVIPLLMNPGDSLQMNNLTGQAVFMIAEKNKKNTIKNSKTASSSLFTKSGYSAAFNQTSLPEVLKKLEEGYKITIQYDSTELSDLYFTGKIKETDQLGTIIRRLEILHALQIKTNTKGLVLQKK